MARDFADYAHDQYPEKVLVSKMGSESGASLTTRMYGERSGSSQSLVGFSVHRPESWHNTNIDLHKLQLNALWTLARAASVPVVWVGETGGFNHTKNDNEIGEVKKNKGQFSVNTQQCQVGKFAEWLWNTLSVNTSTPHTAKSFNEEPIDGFHDWAQDQLGLTVIDMDMITIDNNREPNALVEIKRSNLEDAEDWYPVIGSGGDEPNYRLQIDAADKTGTAPITICHNNNDTYVQDDTTVYYYDHRGSSMNKVRKLGPWRVDTASDFEYDRTSLTALEAIKQLFSE